MPSISSDSRSHSSEEPKTTRITEEQEEKEQGVEPDGDLAVAEGDVLDQEREDSLGLESPLGKGKKEKVDEDEPAERELIEVVTDLPEDLQLRILSFLSASDLLRVHQVCQQWAVLSDHGWLWQRLSKQVWPKCRVKDTPLEHDLRRWKLLYLFGNPFCTENSLRWTIPNLNKTSSTTGGGENGLVSPTTFMTGSYQWRLSLSLVFNNNNDFSLSNGSSSNSSVLILNTKLMNEDALPKGGSVRVRVEYKVYNQKTKAKHIRVSTEVVTLNSRDVLASSGGASANGSGVAATKIDASEILSPTGHYLDVQSNLRIKGKVILLDDHHLLKGKHNLEELLPQLRGSIFESFMKTTFKVRTHYMQ